MAEQARILLFGALLSGAGAVDLARLRFEEVGEAVPTTVPPLPVALWEPSRLGGRAGVLSGYGSRPRLDAGACWAGVA